MSWFDIGNTLVTIPLGEGGYAMSWIEAVGTLFGLLCIWLASQEKTINYLFGLVNVTLFAIIFFQIQLYGMLLLQLFFFCANVYGWYAWTRPANDQGDHLVIRWLPRNKHFQYMMFWYGMAAAWVAVFALAWRRYRQG